MQAKARVGGRATLRVRCATWGWPFPVDASRGSVAGDHVGGRENGMDASVGRNRQDQQAGRLNERPGSPTPPALLLFLPSLFTLFFLWCWCLGRIWQGSDGCECPVRFLASLARFLSTPSQFHAPSPFGLATMNAVGTPLADLVAGLQHVLRKCT